MMGWPGVKSARVADTDEEKIALVLERLEGNFNRAARFVACTALVVNGHLLQSWLGIANGQIAEAASGENGFGYDPIFFDPALGSTFGEITGEEKAKHSHRSKAWKKTLDYINKYNHVLQ